MCFMNVCLKLNSLVCINHLWRIQTYNANQKHADLFEMNFLSDVLDVPRNENRNEDGAHHSMELLRKLVKIEVENYLNPSFMKLVEC